MYRATTGANMKFPGSSNDHILISQLEFVGEADACYGKQKTRHDTRGDVGCSAQPFAVFEHFRRLPTKARKRCVSAEEANRNGQAPARREHDTIHRELADQAQEKAARQVDEQSAVGKSAARANLHETLQAIARERADGAKNGNQHELQRISTSQLDGVRIASVTPTPGATWGTTYNKKHLNPKAHAGQAARSHQSRSEERPGYGELHRL